MGDKLQIPFWGIYMPIRDFSAIKESQNLVQLKKEKEKKSHLDSGEV